MCDISSVKSDLKSLDDSICSKIQELLPDLVSKIKTEVLKDTSVSKVSKEEA
jgi:uncharacterized spore protein YtfJ